MERKRIFKTISLVLGIMAMSVMLAFADKKDDYQKTYNYGRAMELIKEDKNDEAVSFLKKRSVTIMIMAMRWHGWQACNRKKVNSVPH